ncbi:MAG: GIY-YIG nuclease family protein [Candidatus Methanomethylophilaceae archaeon]|nr:GIY-YIG nuclease family protein [Candidatus Methanomethylophilaceae archaeon]
MRRPGCYILILPLPSGFQGRIGSLGVCSLQAGVYCYTGSALSGLDQRLQRHLRKEKTMRWHVDRISLCAQSPWALEFSQPYTECRLALELEALGATPVIPGFGSSDCKCHTHLFLATSEALCGMRARSSGIFPSDHVAV